MIEEVLPDVAALLGVPLEEVAGAFRTESARLEDPEEIAELVRHSLERLIGMEVG